MGLGFQGLGYLVRGVWLLDLAFRGSLDCVASFHGTKRLEAKDSDLQSLLHRTMVQGVRV